MFLIPLVFCFFFTCGGADGESMFSVSTEEAVANTPACAIGMLGLSLSNSCA